jgi:hypothetical protein
MKARILFLMGSLVFAGCKEPKVSSEEAPASTLAATPLPFTGPLYLARRVAISTEESLYGLKPGTELKLIEERPETLLVEAEGMQFEIDPRHTTRDRDLAQTLLARAKKGTPNGQITKVERWQSEDRRFLKEEDIRRSAVEEADLRNAVDQLKRR